jgi:2-keto-3-deoxy-L-rhamnonate aldolase RhmA
MIIEMKLKYITNNVNLALHAELCGIDRIFVDLEQLGKDKRQGHLDTLISNHTIEDVYKIKNVLKKSELLVRVNPINKNSKNEINNVIDSGADIIMLPMFKYKHEVENFIDFVDQRARISLLLETPNALLNLDEILSYSNRIDEVHIGLNDLHIAMGLEFMFELLAGDLIEFIINKIKKHNISYGIGGIACLGQGTIYAEKILCEYLRLGSSMVILSRTFHKNAKTLSDLNNLVDLKYEIELLRNEIERIKSLSENELKLNNNKLKQEIWNLVYSKIK